MIDGKANVKVSGDERLRQRFFADNDFVRETIRMARLHAEGKISDWETLELGAGSHRTNEQDRNLIR